VPNCDSVGTLSGLRIDLRLAAGKMCKNTKDQVSAKRVLVTVHGGAFQETSALHRHRSNQTSLSKMLDLLLGECNFALS